LFTVPFVIGAVGAFLANYDAEVSATRTGQITLAAFFLAGILALVRHADRAAGGGGDRAPAHQRQAAARGDDGGVIDAPPDRVWPQVVSFDALPDPDDPWFRLGIAYPLLARTTGDGVGAPRACVFSTGVFAERVTRWEPARRLTFEVLSSAPPLRELTPYANVHPPHLDGYFRSRRGEFDLIALEGGRTRLEGHSWYELEMAPEGYWQLVADAFVHRVHRRVFEHIRRTAERGGTYLLTASPSMPTSSR